MVVVSVVHHANGFLGGLGGDTFLGAVGSSWRIREIFEVVLVFGDNGRCLSELFAGSSDGFHLLALDSVTSSISTSESLVWKSLWRPSMVEMISSEALPGQNGPGVPKASTGGLYMSP